MRIGCRLFTVFSVWKTTLVKVKHRISSKFNHFPILIYAKYFTIVLIIGSLSNYDDDHNDDFKKTIGLMIKTTALHAHHAF